MGVIGRPLEGGGKKRGTKYGDRGGKKKLGCVAFKF